MTCRKPDTFLLLATFVATFVATLVATVLALFFSNFLCNHHTVVSRNFISTYAISLFAPLYYIGLHLHSPTQPYIVMQGCVGLCTAVLGHLGLRKAL